MLPKVIDQQTDLGIGEREIAAPLMFPGNRALSRVTPDGEARPIQPGWVRLHLEGSAQQLAQGLNLDTNSIGLVEILQGQDFNVGLGPLAAQITLMISRISVGARSFPGRWLFRRCGRHAGATGLPLCGHIRRGGAFARCGAKVLPVSRLLTSTRSWHAGQTATAWVRINSSVPSITIFRGGETTPSFSPHHWQVSTCPLTWS